MFRHHFSVVLHVADHYTDSVLDKRFAKHFNTLHLSRKPLPSGIHHFIFMTMKCTALALISTLTNTKHIFHLEYVFDPKLLEVDFIYTCT